MVIVSNETQHGRNIAYSCNTKSLNCVLEQLLNINRIFFWSDGCASSFWSRYVFYSFLFYPQDVTLSREYGEAHHFKDPHDGIGGSMKRKVYQDVSSNQIVITSAKHFTQYANEICYSVILSLDKTDITDVDVTNAVYIPGTKVSNLIKGVNYVFKTGNTPNSDETDSLPVNETSAIPIPFIGDLYVIKYLFNKKECLNYLGLIQEIVGEEFEVQSLKKACEKAFTVKEGDTDLIPVNLVTKIVTDGDFSVNNRQQYILNEPLTSELDM